MDDIEQDPIVIYYLKLTDGGEKQDEEDANLEVTFSEISLRLALSQLLGKNQMLSSADVELYKKIILLYFSEQTMDVEQLIMFMSPSFDEETVRHLLTPDRREQILKEWEQFKATKLIDIVYKNATIAMLKEYHYRLILLLNGNVHLTLDCVNMQLQNALNFLNWNMKRRHKFAKSMLNLLNDKNVHYINNDSTASEAMTSSLSLEMPTIFEAIKDKLNPWLVRMVEKGVNQCQSTTAVSGKVLHLKRVPAMAMISVSGKKNCSRNQSSKRIIVEVEEVKNIVLEKEDEKEKILYEKNNQSIDIKENPAFQEEIEEINTNNIIQFINVERTPANPAFCNEYEQVNATNNVQYIEIDETCSNPDIHKETNGNDEQSNAASNAKESDKGRDVIDFDTAISYINQIKEYALANELFDAFVPLDQVEDFLRS